MEYQDSQDTIIVADDGSASAQSGAAIAIQIAASLNYQIHGMYVVDETLVMDPYANYHSEMADQGDVSARSSRVAEFEALGGAALGQLEERCQAVGIEATVDIIFGGLTRAVVHQADQARLLVLGRRGHEHEADNGHLGEHFREIAHQTATSVLVGGDKPRRIERLLLAYNGSKNAHYAATWATHLQRALPAQVTVLAVTDQNNPAQGEEWLDEVRGSLDSTEQEIQRNAYQFLNRSGRPESVILEVAREEHADLIVMGGYSHMAVLEWITGSTVDQVLRSSRLPVLIAKAA